MPAVLTATRQQQQQQESQQDSNRLSRHLSDMGYDAEYAFVPSSVTTKAAFYDHVLDSLKGLLAVQEGEKHDWVCSSLLEWFSSILEYERPGLSTRDLAFPVKFPQLLRIQLLFRSLPRPLPKERFPPCLAYQVFCSTLMPISRRILALHGGSIGPVCICQYSSGNISLG